MFYYVNLKEFNMVRKENSFVNLCGSSPIPIDKRQERERRKGEEERK